MELSRRAAGGRVEVSEGARSSGRLSTFIVRQRRPIALGWLVLVAVLFPLANRASATFDVSDTALVSSEAQRVERVLATRFGSPFAVFVALVASGIPAHDSATRRALEQVADSIRQLPFVLRTSWHNAAADTSRKARIAVLLVGLEADAATADATIVSLRETTRRLQIVLRRSYAGAQLAWTGAPAINYDVRLTSSVDAATAERRVLPVILLLLVVVFGGAIAALLPATVGILAIGMSLGLAVLIGHWWPLTILLRNITSMLGLGLGVDYALLTVSRFREELRGGAGTEQAACEAVRHAGKTVLISGGSVAIGFAALLVVPATELRSIAIGGLLVTSISALLATTLLPGILAWLGTRVEGMRLLPEPRRENAGHLWRRWGRWATTHPVLVLAAAGLPMTALALQSRRLSADIPSQNWLPARTESTRATNALLSAGYTGIIQTIRVVVELPRGVLATSEAGWRAILRLSRLMSRDARVARAQSLPLILSAEHPSPSLLAFVPSLTRSAYLSRDERLALIELVPAERESPAALARFVRDLRRLDIAAMSGLPGVFVSVGGLPAANADYQDAIGGNVVRVVWLVVVSTMLALFVGFGSLLVPIKAVLLNLLTVAAAFGTAVLVFQDGWGSSVMGLATPLDGLFPAVPIIVFCVVFGLSMDYEVFLVARVAEGVRSGLSDRDAVTDALGRTGRVITSAALVMLVVFSGFAMGEFIIVKILGFTLAVAVLLDATVMRIAIGPALITLAGRWNWWPRERRGAASVE